MVLFKVVEVNHFQQKSWRFRSLKISRHCIIDVGFPLMAAEIGYQNIIESEKIHNPDFKEPFSYRTTVWVQTLNKKDNYMFHLKRNRNPNTKIYRTRGQLLYGFHLNGVKSNI